ncbi:hypothetical protein L598_004100000120 [Mesorhizobium sp. J18]|uniref:hypothetical protein n=1 Tax=Mesorhizobium sp. J18 TaxID=935263 RepID=UPI00119C3F9F|nr:hypothetical protein [Mesorhizobium sp. J18]TWG93367.1 hypothetical protein L598_004100000120 [Mesorhizobium sp. J18]
MAGTKHSMDEAREIQKAFEKKFGGRKGLLGVGICLNPRRDDLAINVSVSRSAQASDLPKTFDGLDVVVDVVGTVRAF